MAGIAHTVLVVLHVWRILAFRAAVAADLPDPGLGFGFFTFIAGTDVLGTRLAADGHHRAAVVLLAVGWLAWLVPGYVVPWSAVLGHSRFPLGQDANGHLIHLGRGRPVGSGACRCARTSRRHRGARS